MIDVNNLQWLNSRAESIAKTVNKLIEKERIQRSANNQGENDGNKPK